VYHILFDVLTIWWRLEIIMIIMTNTSELRTTRIISPAARIRHLYVTSGLWLRIFRPLDFCCTECTSAIHATGFTILPGKISFLRRKLSDKIYCRSKFKIIWDLWWAKWRWDRSFSEFSPCQYNFIVALHIHISSGIRTIEPLVAAVQRHSLTPST
jgi:hypothetical protein